MWVISKRFFVLSRLLMLDIRNNYSPKKNFLFVQIYFSALFSCKWWVFFEITHRKYEFLYLKSQSIFQRSISSFKIILFRLCYLAAVEVFEKGRKCFKMKWFSSFFALVHASMIVLFPFHFFSNVQHIPSGLSARYYIVCCAAIDRRWFCCCSEQPWTLNLHILYEMCG